MSDLIELSIDRVAHGGHCVGRDGGRVVFVRHCLPGERVLAKVTSEGRRGRFRNADAVEILEPAAGRVAPPCPLAGSGGCGGCDWQHADMETQRNLKTAVVAEQLQRGADFEWLGQVEAVPGDTDGLAWRTRVRYAVDRDGHVGFRKHHSHDVVQVDRCVIASAEVQAATCLELPVSEQAWSSSSVTVVGPGEGTAVVQECEGAPQFVNERAVGRDWRVPIDGFWQVHPGAAEALSQEIVSAVADSAIVWDLYAGVGLFAGALADARSGRHIEVVESNRSAADCARSNLADSPRVRVHHRSVERWLAGSSEKLGRVDAVVMDPPRKGVGATALRALSETTAERLVYVACDPASLARDAKTLLGWGWKLESLRAFDIFPMTHHVESVALFRRAARAAR